MLRRRAGAAVIAAVSSALVGMTTPAGAQHERHGVPAGSARVALTGTAYGAEHTPLSGAIVRLRAERRGDHRRLRGQRDAGHQHGALAVLAPVVVCDTQRLVPGQRPIEPIRFSSGASPTAPMAVPLEDAQAVYDAASDPEEVLYYDTGHNFVPSQATADRFDWLSKHLGTDT